MEAKIIFKQIDNIELIELKQELTGMSDRNGIKLHQVRDNNNISFNIMALDNNKTRLSKIDNGTEVQTTTSDGLIQSIGYEFVDSSDSSNIITGILTSATNSMNITLNIHAPDDTPMIFDERFDIGSLPDATINYNINTGLYDITS